MIPRFCRIAALGVLLTSTSAQSITMMSNFRDLTFQDPAREVRYQNLANQARFASVGSFNNGVLGNTRSSFCTGTLIGPNTVLTAAHCLWDDALKRRLTRNELELKTFTFGPSPNNASEVLRVTNYYIAPNSQNTIDQTNNGRDYALLQVYREGPAGEVLPSTLTPMGIYSAQDEITIVNNQLQFPVLAGYGSTVYNQPGNWERHDQLKRAALNDRIERTEAADGVANGYLLTQHDGGGNLFLRGLPNNFLEGGLAPGDSGGAFMIRDASNQMALIGINAYIWPTNSPGNAHFDATKNQFQDNFPAQGGVESGYLRASLFRNDILGHLFAAPSNTDSWPFQLPAAEGFMEAVAASPVSFSIQTAPDASTSTWSFDYQFVDAVGKITVCFQDLVLFELGAPGDQAGTANFTIDGSQLWDAYLNQPGPVPVTGMLGVKFTFEGPTGSRLRLDNLAFAGNVNGDFFNGLLGYGLDDAGHFRLEAGSFTGSGPAVPEPFTWALMLTGFGLVGATARRRKSRTITG